MAAGAIRRIMYKMTQITTHIGATSATHRETYQYPTSNRRLAAQRLLIDPASFSDVVPTSFSDVNPMSFPALVPMSVSDLGPTSEKLPGYVSTSRSVHPTSIAVKHALFSSKTRCIMQGC